MSQAISRAQFLRGDFTNQHAAIRPPWALPEAKFVDSCTRCGACIEQCPEQIIISGKSGFPQINFARGECTFCHRCVDSCEHEAFFDDLDKFAWNLTASISNQCLVYQGVHCMICREQCEPRAIVFIHKAGLPAYPMLNAETCNGCGACYKPCPSRAIKLSYQNTQKEPHKETGT